MTCADYLVYDTPTALAQAAAAVFAETVHDGIAARGVARLAVSGGSTSQQMFSLLAEEPYRSGIDWSRLHLYWVDERCVPPADANSNYGVAYRDFLSKVPLPESNLFRMEGELPAEEAASRYEAVLRNSFRLEGAEVPAFDLVLLGLGEDGHTASIFPNSAAVDALGTLVAADFVEKKEAWRITLTWPVINHGRRVVFLVEGAAKAEVLHEVLLGKYDPDRLPAQLIRPENGKLELLLDADAARRLPKFETQGDAEKGTLELTR